MAIKVFQLHKRSSYEYKFIQDKYSYSLGSKVYTLSDGATQSIHSEKWAELITNSFANNPIFKPNELIVEFIRLAKVFKEIKIDFNDNPAKALLEKKLIEKGATATFVGVQINKNQLSLISCGDSNFFIIRNNELIASFPFSTCDELDINKHFLNTENLLAGEVEESFFITKNFEIEISDIIILATDALSRLLLNNTDTLKYLLQSNDFETFKTFCLKYWDEKKMEEDDISAIILDSNSNQIIEILPPEGFAFPKEKEIEFIPYPQSTTSLNQKNENDMQQLSFIVERFNKEIDVLKKKLKFHEMLLMLAVSLIPINIFLVFYLRIGQPETNSKKMEQDFNQKMLKVESDIQHQKEELEVLTKKIKFPDSTISIKEEKISVKMPKVEKQNTKVISKYKKEVKDTSKNESSKRINKIKD